MRLAWLLLCFSGCQCLVPVNELPDGGHDAGTNSTPECTQPSDCGGNFKTVDWCFGDGGADWSCVDRHCVAQCQDHGGQTCESESSGCIKCPPTAACALGSCTLTRDARWHIDQISCRAASPLQLGDVLHQVPDGGCQSTLILERDGGSTAYGNAYLQSDYSYTARIDELGGTCLVSLLPTNVERMIFECPRCQFVVANW